MKAVRRVSVTKHDHQRPVEIGAAVDLKRVSVGVSGELGPIALQK